MKEASPPDHLPLQLPGRASASSMMLNMKEASSGGVASPREKKSFTVRILNKIHRSFFKHRLDRCCSFDPDSHDRSPNAKHPNEGLGIYGDIRDKSVRYGDGNGTFTPKSCLKKRNTESPTSMPRSQTVNGVSWRSKSSTPSLDRNSTGKKDTRNNNSINDQAQPETETLPRVSSRKIMFSDSNGTVKAPSMEKNLECSLEELCFGCKKKIKVDRDVVHTKSGKLAQEEEILKVKVKPGWRQGTKITFEGKKKETSGEFTADVTFVITEEEHPLFRRDGDDLEVTVEIPLVKALTGCTVPVTLLGGETMKLEIEDIIHPGFEHNISGQGMPIFDEQQTRGDLRVLFLIKFPSQLADEQRKEIVRILQECSWAAPTCQGSAKDMVLLSHCKVGRQEENKGD